MVSIISLVYFFTLDNFKFSNNIKSSKVPLESLPLYLTKYNDKFSNNLKLICIKDGEKCLLYLDNNKEEEIKGLFNNKPIVYKYNKKLDEVYYEDIELKHLDRYEVCFKYEINKYRKSKDMIVEVNDKIYVFNSIYKKAIILEDTSEIYDYFDNLNNEVKDAL